MVAPSSRTTTVSPAWAAAVRIVAARAAPSPLRCQSGVAPTMSPQAPASLAVKSRTTAAMPHDSAMAIRTATAIGAVLGVLLAPAPGRAAGPAGIIEHGPRTTATVALTFDLCPTRQPELDERIVSALVVAG